MKVRALALASVVALASTVIAAENFEVDAVHSCVTFKIKHMGVSYSYGRFNKVSGKISLDENDASKNSFEIEVKTDSIDTNDAKRDQHLRGPDFFNSKEFPKITFKSTKVEKKGDNWAVTGDLTLHGVTKPITIEIVPSGKGPTLAKDVRAGAETTFTIKRSDFDMKYGVDNGALGDDVTLMVSIEAIKK